MVNPMVLPPRIELGSEHYRCPASPFMLRELSFYLYQQTKNVNLLFYTQESQPQPVMVYQLCIRNTVDQPEHRPYENGRLENTNASLVPTNNIPRRLDTNHRP